jgi:hypothetical protein
MRPPFPPGEVAFDPLGQFMRDPVERSEVRPVLADYLNCPGGRCLYDFVLCTRLCTIPLFPSYNISYKFGSDLLLNPSA